MLVSSYPHAVLFLVSAPSGTGKTTLCHRLLADEPLLRFSVSSTTRQPRKGEVDGQDYNFISRDEFRGRVEKGVFLEHAEVHGNLYGTEAAVVEDFIRQGYSVMLDVDVQGAQLIREALSGRPHLQPLFHDVFLRPPSLESLRVRLEQRGKDTPEVIEERLHNAEKEMREAHLYRYQLVNDNLDHASKLLKSIYRACTCSTLPE